VSLFDQPSFTPEAVSLTGRAFFTNTQGLRVPFGGQAHTRIRGAQTSAVQQADSASTTLQADYLARTDFEIQELTIVSQRGGFIRGDVVVGDLYESDFIPNKFPGVLNFVLTWTGGPQQILNDLNLAVFSPLSPPPDKTDFVANPPFIYSLNPNSPASKQIRASSYPAVSQISGGRISANSVGPDGLEVAYWGKNYPVGTYTIRVFNLLDALVDANHPAPPGYGSNPVSYIIDVFLNGNQLPIEEKGKVGFLQTSPEISYTVPPITPTHSSVESTGSRIARPGK
jgi:hypothetical protein